MSTATIGPALERAARMEDIIMRGLARAALRRAASDPHAENEPRAWLEDAVERTCEAYRDDASAILDALTPLINAALRSENPFVVQLLSGDPHVDLEVAYLREALRRCAARAGLPDAGDACRAVIATAQEALAKSTGG